jgi:uncharacterized damage-inducible protein DinB
MPEAPAMESLRYPTGRFERPVDVTPEDRAAWIEEIAALPARLRAAVGDLSDERLDTPYRDGGWTVRQLVHHVADSHMNAHIRLSLATAEEGREAGLYDEKRWAEQPFARTGPPAPSLTILDGLHARWVATLRSLPDEAWSRSIRHAEFGSLTVDELTALYAWHSRHHVAHVTRLREREGW